MQTRQKGRRHHGSHQTTKGIRKADVLNGTEIHFYAAFPPQNEVQYFHTHCLSPKYKVLSFLATRRCFVCLFGVFHVQADHRQKPNSNLFSTGDVDVDVESFPRFPPEAKESQTRGLGRHLRHVFGPPELVSKVPGEQPLRPADTRISELPKEKL